MLKSKINLGSSGFTLVELLLAMALFSFMLLIITAGFLNIVKIYESGQASRDTQQNTRFGMEQMIREARGAYAVKYGANAVCFYQGQSSTKFFVEASQLKQGTLVSANPRDGRNTNCTPDNISPNSPVEPSSVKILSSGEVKVVELVATRMPNIDPPITLGQFYSVTLTLRIASDVSLLTSSQKMCDPTQSGSQFCSLTSVTSSANLRGQP